MKHKHTFEQYKESYELLLALARRNNPAATHPVQYVGKERQISKCNICDMIFDADNQVDLIDHLFSDLKERGLLPFV
jgi:hypothetical protein